MSFSDWQWNIEQTFIQPLQNFRKTVTAFNQVHNDCMDKIGTILGGLLTGSDGEEAFQGAGSDALANTIGQFLDTEQRYAGSSDYLIGRLDDASSIYEKAARDLQQRLDQIASESGQSGAVEGAGGIALGLDTGAAAQGFIDVPWDIVALGVTAIAVIGAATSNPDEVRSRDAQAALDIAITEVNTNIQSGPDTEPLPELSPDPQGPKGDYQAFLKTLGIIVGIGATGLGVYLVFNGLPVAPDKKIQQLTADERAALVKYLAETYGCSPQQVQAIMQRLGYQSLTAAQLERIIQVLKIRAQIQNLLNQAQRSGLNTDGFQRMLRGDLNTIDKDIKSGQAATWTDSNVEGWENNLSGAAYQWEAAQKLHATQIETQGTDFISNDGTWYETKNVNNIQYDDDTYIKILNQLKRYARMGAHSVGVVVPPDADPNLLNDLKRDLAKYGIYDVKVVRMPYQPPDTSGSNWCSLP